MNILICPLDWGLGHATRCVPVINHLLKKQCRVFIAGSGRSQEFLKMEFPGCCFVDLPSYRFSYSRKGKMMLAMLLSAPMILWGILKEHLQLKRIIRQHNIHGVISDNRFGLWSRKVTCVYMTHQVKIRTPETLRFARPFLFLLHRFFINKYDWLWIPDNELPPTLAGDLAHNFNLRTKFRYVGPLSRFSFPAQSNDAITETEHAEILAIVSGPEPQRSIFESLIIKQSPVVQEKIILLRGLPGKNPKPEISGNLSIYSHVGTSRLRQMIEKAGIVLCRPGYSSIMDLAVLGKKAFFVPTPGQTEQEYLAAFLREQGICNFSTQDEFRLSEIKAKSAGFTGFAGMKFRNGIEEAVDEMIAELRKLK